MKTWGTVLLVLAVLAAPALACGFPLPAGTALLAVSKAVCAEGESVATCQARQDAYQSMNKLQSVAIEDLTMSLYVDDGEQVTSATLAGSYEFVVTTDDLLGGYVHAVLTDGQIDTGDSNPESLQNMEFIIYGSKGYTSYDGGKTWVVEELDATELSGMGMLLGLGGSRGASLNLFADPTVFNVTIGPSVQIDGQVMDVQTLTLDLPKLLANADAMTRLLQQGTAAGGDLLNLTEEDLQNFDPAQIALLSGLLLPLMQGTGFSTTLYIGEEDGYIHRIEDSYVLLMDLPQIDPQSKPLKMSYLLSGTITQHNAPLVINEPQNATQGQGIFGEGGVFGGSGLGSSIFGGSSGP
ncbi:MAG TPA: hypothetical protein VMT24_09450 [Aggregatilineaceae bacterium]|nr:hypothetical protein [Aggregatilineaceae bacterium]